MRNEVHVAKPNSKAQRTVDKAGMHIACFFDRVQQVDHEHPSCTTTIITEVCAKPSAEVLEEQAWERIALWTQHGGIPWEGTRVMPLEEQHGKLVAASKCWVEPLDCIVTPGKQNIPHPLTATVQQIKAMVKSER